MAEQALARRASSSAITATGPLIHDLFDLAASRDLDTLLNRALRMAIGILNAEAGSILFQAQAPVNIRAGAFRQEALARIQRWEEVIRKRLQEVTSNIPSSKALPVSVTQLPASHSALVNVPLVQQTKVVGSLSLVLPPGSNLGDEQRNLLKHIATSLGHIASLIVELELANRRLRQFSVFYEVGQALITTFDITSLLAEAMALAADVIDAGAASILLVDETGKELVFRVSHGHRGHILRQQRIPLDEGIAGWVVRNKLPVIANDARADSRFSHRVDVRTGFLTQSIAAVPLKIKGRIIGVLEVLNKYSGQGFNQEDIQLMNSIASQAAIAIENSRLYEELRDERDNIIHAQDDFRRELIRKLQDGPMQLLSGIGMSLEHLERLNIKANPDIVQNEIGALHNLVRQANKATHNILFDLHPLILEEEGLIAAIKQLVQQLKSSEKLNIQFRSVEEANYNYKTTSVIFFVIQEALNNIKRHANAETIWLSLDTRGKHFIVTIRDNGQGFEVNQFDDAGNKRLFVGLATIRELAQSVGAKFQINSSTGGANRGTIIQVVLPWPPQPDSHPSL